MNITKFNGNLHTRKLTSQKCEEKVKLNLD